MNSGGMVRNGIVNSWLLIVPIFGHLQLYTMALLPGEGNNGLPDSLIAILIPPRQIFLIFTSSVVMAMKEMT